MVLIPIKETLKENQELTNNPDLKDIINMSMDFYKRVGFVPPWIGYMAEENGQLIGFGGFKGQPMNRQVEIAYGTIERFRKKGAGTLICKKLVEMALNTDSSVIITARTLPENNFSTRILEKNNFSFLGTVMDPEDGEVWEWKYKSNGI